MSERFIYENARIKSMEVKLLTSQSLQRLFDCTTQSAAFRTLCDMGFGVGASVEQDDFDALFKAEEARQVAFLKEFNVAGALDAFLIQYDFLNLKFILKAQAQGKEPVDRGPEGLLSYDDVKAIAEEQNEEKLTGDLGRATLETRALAAAKKLTPRAIDITVDKFMYRRIFASLLKGGKLLKRYFELKVDAANLLSYLRCKKLGLGSEFFQEGFIDGGKLVALKGMYDSTQEALWDAVKGTEFAEDFKKAADGGDLIAFEVACDNILLAMIKKERDDMFSVAPIAAYYLSRVTELKAAKLIVAGIKNGVDETLIRERLRDV